MVYNVDSINDLAGYCSVGTSAEPFFLSFFLLNKRSTSSSVSHAVAGDVVESASTWGS